jgi:hypothetical protein
VSSFTGTLAIDQLPDGVHWKQLRDLIYYAGEENSLEAYLIPFGFVTDGGSIPSWAQPFVGPPMGPAAPAYDLHDWLYRTQGLTMLDMLKHPDFRHDVSLLEGSLEKDDTNWTGPKGTMTRQRADYLLWEAMGCLGINRVKRWLVYYGLRVGGWAAWNKYRKDQAKDAR